MPHLGERLEDMCLVKSTVNELCECCLLLRQSFLFTMGITIILENTAQGGAWVAQSVRRPTLAQVMISRSVSLSSASGSGLMAQSLEPVSDSVSLSLTLPRSCSVSLCRKNK